MAQMNPSHGRKIKDPYTSGSDAGITAHIGEEPGVPFSLAQKPTDIKV